MNRSFQRRRALISLAIATVFALAIPAQAQEKLSVWWVKGFYKSEDDALYEAIRKFEAKTGIKVDLSQYPVQDMIPKTVAALDAGTPPDVAYADVYDFQVAGNFNQERMIARLTTLFGVLSLLLASIGLYGITSYQVTQRTREIGLRIAFGAGRNRVVGLVMRGAFIQVALGLALGIPIVLVGARYVANQLYLVKSYDPVSLLVATAVLAGAAMIAGFIPARRAASIDPMRALRSE